ncbi:helix-turn-helix domain-containing protein [Rhizobium sp. BT-175]|nr:helix-turn-helix transcriptional regulator [Rhizobium sp. BT-175]MCV9947456.1 helix-turn-helix domain-containing protein [Rhizobium sp. BT-175]
MSQTPHEVDVIVGRAIRTKRALRGISQAELGQRVGVTFQQIQKYEKGTNRVSASKLYEIACALKVDGSRRRSFKSDEIAEYHATNAVRKIACPAILEESICLSTRAASTPLSTQCCGETAHSLRQCLLSCRLCGRRGRCQCSRSPIRCAATRPSRSSICEH